MDAALNQQEIDLDLVKSVGHTKPGLSTPDYGANFMCCPCLLSVIATGNRSFIPS